MNRMGQALAQAWSGQSGWGRILSVALLPISWVYGGLMAIRRWFYQLGLYKTHSLPVPVVVVGNVMVGGVGKTPITIALVNHLSANGWRVGVLSRGYGRSTTGTLAVTPDSSAHEVGDEPLLIARTCKVPVYVGSSRVDAAHTLLSHHPEVQVLVCDDGLQHWALARDLELCVFDERGIGNGHLLPAGPLREVWPRKTGDQDIPCWVIYSSDHEGSNGVIAQRHLADFAVQADGTRRELQSWGNAQVQALAGIAKPEAFFAMLREKGLALTHTQALPDHAQMQDLHIDPSRGDVFCTEKDAVKLWAHHPKAWAVPLQTTLPHDLLNQINQHLKATQHAKLSSPHGHQTA